MLKGAVNDSCPQNWDHLDHYQLFLQRTLTHTSPSFPSITINTSGQCKGILGWKLQSLNLPMHWWNRSSHLNFVKLSIIWQEPCFTSFHVLVFLNAKPTLPFLSAGLLQAQNLLTQLPQQSQANLLQSQPSITLASQVRLFPTLLDLLWGDLNYGKWMDPWC